MKCKVFTGELGEVEVAFNTWAKGKGLTKDVIIHTIAHYIYDKTLTPKLTIAVYYLEGSHWDKEPETPKQQNPKWNIPEIKIIGKVEQL